MSSESSSKSPSVPLRLVTQFVLTILLVWVMVTYLGDYFVVTGGWVAYVIVGALLTLMNILVRPILALVTLPLKLFATILAIILVNGGFLWLTMYVTNYMDPALLSVRIEQGITGWAVVAVVFGLAHWLMRAILR